MMSMPQSPITADPQLLAIACRILARTMLLSVAGTVMAVVGTASFDFAAAQDTDVSSDSPPSSPALERVLGTESSSTEQQGEVSGNPTLSELDLDRLPSPFEPGVPLAVDLSQLVLIPNPATVSWLDEQFEIEIAPINSRIALRQEMLQQLLGDPDSNDNRIRQVQAILSQLRAERDRIAIEHLLLVRQVSESGTLPTQATSSGME